MSKESRYVHSKWHLEAPSLVIGLAQPQHRTGELVFDFDDPSSFKLDSGLSLPSALSSSQGPSGHHGNQFSGNADAIHRGPMAVDHVLVDALSAGSVIQWGDLGLPTIPV